MLHKLSIRSLTGTEKLLKVIKNPITDHLPTNCVKITMSSDAPVVKTSHYVTTLPKDKSICFFVGAFASGPDEFANVYGLDDKIGVSEYNLSASITCGKICNAFEDMWNIL